MSKFIPLYWLFCLERAAGRCFANIEVVLNGPIGAFHRTKNIM
ncbi:hypothetical protein N8347_03750 [Amylibacter sp.]|nr:hypothetical protein [Amylibacter sp.]